MGSRLGLYGLGLDPCIVCVTLDPVRISRSLKRSGLLRLVAPCVICLFPLARADGCGDACKEELIYAYFERLDAVYKSGSSSRDIDALFALFHPSVKYEHPAYGADFEVAEWREGFEQNLANGSFNHSQAEEIRVTQLIHGKDHSAVEYRYGTRTANGWTPKDGPALLALFGFADEKIALVREYW